MNRALIALGALGLWVFASRKKAPTFNPPGPKCPPGSTRVLLIGDSLAVGLAPRLGALAEQCGTPYTSSAFVGAHVTEWTGERLTAALAAKPNVVMISLGGNDFQRTDPEKVRAAISLLLERIVASGARPYWIGPPSMPFDDRIGVRQMWRDALSLYPFETTAAWLNTDEDLAGELPREPDDIHPTPAGYDLLASYVWRWMAQLERAR